MSTIAVKEKPILFSSPMVRAILNGKKTQTRRIVDIMQLEPELAATREERDRLAAELSEWREDPMDKAVREAIRGMA